MKVFYINARLTPPGVPPLINIHKNERLKYICDNIIDDYDVLLFTEVFGNYKFAKFMEFHPSFSRVKYLKRRAAEKGYKYSLRQGNELKDCQIEGDMMILSRYPITKSYGIVYKDTNTFGYCSKGAIYAKIKGINFFLTHMTSDSHMGFFKIGCSVNIRKKQMVQLDNFIKHHSKDNELSVVVGDMNFAVLCDGRNSLDIFGEYKHFTQSLGLHDVSLEKYGYHIPTYESKYLKFKYDYVLEKVPNNSGHYVSDINLKKLKTPGMPFKQVSDHYGLEFYIAPLRVAE